MAKCSIIGPGVILISSTRGGLEKNLTHSLQIFYEITYIYFCGMLTKHEIKTCVKM